jgi:hypothetical protein
MKTETWYKVETDFAKSTKEIEDFGKALRYFLNLPISAKIIELQGANSTGKTLLEKA